MQQGLGRETSFDPDRNTDPGAKTSHISAAMGQRLLSGSYIQADEITVAVQMHGITITWRTTDGSSVPNRWPGMNLREQRNFTTGQRTKLH